MVVSAKVTNGKAIHRAIDMGGFYYIVCHADRTTLKTEVIKGDVTCKKCLAAKETVYPNYAYEDYTQGLKHPFVNQTKKGDVELAGYNDGFRNLKSVHSKVII